MPARDIRFADSPLVVEKPWVRFYAGQPVRGPGGMKVGTLCVLDSKPRKFGERDLSMCANSARWWKTSSRCAMRFVLRKEAEEAQTALKASEARLEGMVRELQAAKRHGDQLLRNIFPDALVAELRDYGRVEPQYYEDVSVLFADFPASRNSPRPPPHPRSSASSTTVFCHFDWVVAKHGVEKLKTIGDGYLAVSGMPLSKPDDPLRLLRVAFELRDYIDERRRASEANGKTLLEHPDRPPCWSARGGCGGRAQARLRRLGRHGEHRLARRKRRRTRAHQCLG